MSRDPQRSLRRALGLGKLVLISASTFVAIASMHATSLAGPTDGSIDRPSDGPVGSSPEQLVATVPADQERLAELMSRHECSTTGFGPDVIPGSSLVLDGGRLRHVSFDHGWAVHTGARDGTLLAVCLTTLNR